MDFVRKCFTVILMRFFRFSAIILAIFLSVSLSACTDTPDGEHDPDTENTPEIELPEVPRSVSYDIESGSFSDLVVAEDGTVLLTVSADYPIISNPYELENIDTLNELYAENAQSYIDGTLEDLEQVVLDAYAEDADGFLPHSYEMTFEIDFNKNGFLSINRIFNEDGGDGLGVITEYYPHLIDMTTGTPLSYEALFSVPTEDIIQIIYLGFDSAAKSDPGRYYENYQDIINSERYNLQFCLTDRGVEFIMLPGVISKRQYGSRIFIVPFEDNEHLFNPIVLHGDGE